MKDRKKTGALPPDPQRLPGREADRPHMGLNTLSFLLPPAGAGIYLALRHATPLRAAAAGRWAWAGIGFYAGCYLVLWLCFRQ